MNVARLSVTPMKGTQLQDRAFIELGANGVADNRRFHAIDERGLMFNGKREGRLVAVGADYDQRTERLVLRFPDGTEIAGSWTAGEAVVTSFYGRPVAGHIAVGPWSKALSEFSGEPVRLVAVDQLGDAVDVHPVTIVSGASIESLRKSKAGAERLDYRRFRMLVELDGLEAHEEDTWSGRRVRIGSAVVEVVGPVPRCIVTQQNPQSGENDFDTLKAIVSYRGALSGNLLTPSAHLPDGGKVVFGVYGRVIESGRIAVGDGVAVV
jgi:uncharacterized protein YcbX